MNDTLELVSPHLTQHGIMKPCMMTVYLHDFAYPKPPMVQILPFIKMEGKSKPPVPLAIFGNVTMEHLRSLSDEQIGKVVRVILNKLDDEKIKIQKQ